jgi:hypothetical protein
MLRIPGRFKFFWCLLWTAWAVAMCGWLVLIPIIAIGMDLEIGCGDEEENPKENTEA